MHRNCSTLIFDLDGTISDPSLGIARCANHALSACGFDRVPEAAVHRQIGPPLDLLFRNLAPGVKDAQLEALVAAYRQRYSDIGFAENRLYPDMVSTLAALSQAGLRLGVCTSKRRDFAVRILELFAISEYFAFVDGGEIGVPKGSQLAGLMNAGQVDSRAIMVGDRAVDLVAAAANQLRAVGVLWGFGGRDELQHENPWQLISQPGDLLPLVT